MHSDTIVAQCTPSGSGAIALLRVSGKQAFSIVNQCAQLSSGKSLTAVETHSIHHGWIIDNAGKKLDEVLFLVMQAPRTFTGEHTVEITSHNNQFLIETLLERIIACGARPAQPGEFTRTAVENNKIDLLQAEAINELIHANSQQALKHALDQLEGTLSHHVAFLEKKVLQIIGLCEASFEFLEEDVDFSGPMRERLQEILTVLASLRKNFDQQQLVRQGVRIALVGTVNAGKSSLFNALIGKNRAIVTPIAGTTRDVIEAGNYRNGMYWTFIDTAGLRNTHDIVEKEGIERSYHEAHHADIVLLVHDSSRLLTDAEKAVYETILSSYPHKTILVHNKIDVLLPLTLKNNFSSCITATHVSTKTLEGVETLHNILIKRVEELVTKTNCPFLLNKRHMILLTSFENKLLTISTLLQQPIEYELVAYHLKEALAVVTELTGKSVSEKAMDMIFKDFCVGK
jgi:tRNA modification GTPase